jgi:hypothetical protein
MGQRLNIIVIAEGAIDSEGRPISSDSIREVCNAFFFVTLILFEYLSLFQVDLNMIHV